MAGSTTVSGAGPRQPSRITTRESLASAARIVVKIGSSSLTDEHGRLVRVVLSREDSVRLGPKRPPIAAGLHADGSGIVRVVRTPGIAERIRAVLPEVDVEEVDVAGPRTSTALRGAGWAEGGTVALQGQPWPADEGQGGQSAAFGGGTGAAGGVQSGRPAGPPDVRSAGPVHATDASANGPGRAAGAECVAISRP